MRTYDSYISGKELRIYKETPFVENPIYDPNEKKNIDWNKIQRAINEILPYKMKAIIR